MANSSPNSLANRRFYTASFPVILYYLRRVRYAAATVFDRILMIRTLLKITVEDRKIEAGKREQNREKKILKQRRQRFRTED
jgi:hypothetical protein